MRKQIISGLLAAGMLLAGSSVAYAGDMHDCVADKAAAELSAGQAAFVAAFGDGEINAFSVAREHNLNGFDVAQSHAFMWTAGIACAAGN